MKYLQLIDTCHLQPCLHEIPTCIALHTYYEMKHTTEANFHQDIVF